MPSFQFGIGERWALVERRRYAAVAVLLRSAAPTIDPALGSLVRLLPLAVIAWVSSCAAARTSCGPARRASSPGASSAPCCSAGALSLVVGNILYFQALNAGGLGITAGAVQGGLGARRAVDRLPRPARAAAAEQVVGALIVIAGLGGDRSRPDREHRGAVVARARARSGAGTTYALANALSRIVQKSGPLLFVTLAVSSLGGLVPLPIIVGARQAMGETIVADAPSISSVLVAGVANAVALASLALAVRTAPVASVNTISSASVVFAFVASVFVFGESGSVPMIAGILLVTAGIVASQIRRGARPADRPTAPVIPPEAVT